jgi:hypothetical protein
MTTGRSNSVGNIGSLYYWLKENLTFFFMRVNGLKNKNSQFTSLLNEIDSYTNRYKLATGLNLKEATILEIGYGARPNRLIALNSLGYAASGIDLDRPILKGTLAEFVQVYKRNGWKRFFKSLVRHALFDKHERRSLGRILKSRGCKLKLDESKFLVGDACIFEFPPESVDFIYSEDVFEHIPLDAIHTLSRNLSHALSPNGLALISPAVYTGIAGGHLVEWYPHTLESTMARDSEPWEHLRKRRYRADCYLNELLVQDYEDIFKKYFDIIEVLSIDSGLGKQHLTNEIKKELSAYSEAELLSHKWTFVLRKKGVGH